MKEGTDYYGFSKRFKLWLRFWFPYYLALYAIVATSALFYYSRNPFQQKTLLQGPSFSLVKRQQIPLQPQCKTVFDCGNGNCVAVFNSSICQCNSHWTNNVNGGYCNYYQKDKLTAFLVSFFVGTFGADWFYLSDGNGGYIAAGVFKLITIGGCTIWSTVDWIRILCNAFPDGNGYQPFMNF